MTAADRYPSYRAPQVDRDILCEPRWSTLPQVVKRQQAAVDSSSVVLVGHPLSKLALEARRQMLIEARAYTNAYAEYSIDEVSDGPIIITGHQPELIHAGVWLKNFAAAQLADAVGGVAVNLVIDSDLCRTPSIRVLTGSVQQPRVVDVAYDQAQMEVPYEQRTVADQKLWQSFGERVKATLSPLLANPLISDWWPSVVSASAQTSKIGYAIAQARHRLELEWGSQSLELPQSRVCQTRPFWLFAQHLLTNAERFRADYNHALSDYRLAHRLRSVAQPLPDLQAMDGWIETPFWIWTSKNPTRRALFVKQNAAELLLSDRDQWQATLPISAEQGSDATVVQFEQWERSGIKIRTRALTTTLYARLLLSDIFIHGIGGAKYDQVTDEISRRFFGFELPQYVALSGTLRMPIDHRSVSADAVPTLRRLLRELRYHPEKHIDAVKDDAVVSAEIDRLVATKQHWVHTPKSKANAAERHAQINTVNKKLYGYLKAKRDQCERELAVSVSQIRINKLLESREYPFCLFPQQELQDFLLDFSSRMP